MLFTALVLSAVLLVVVNLEVRYTHHPVPAVLLSCLGLAVAPWCLMFSSPPVMLQAVLICAVVVVWRVWNRRPRFFVLLSCLATVVAFGIMSVVAVREQLELAELRKQFPYESIENRLPPPRPDARLGPPPAATAQRLLHFADAVDQESGRYRAIVLQRLHERTVDLFINSPGFGVTRMFRPSRSSVTDGLREDFLVPQPGLPFEMIESSGEFDTAAPLADQEDLLRMHDASVLDFVHPAGFGYIKDRRHVAGFQAHQFSRVPQPIRQWQLQHLDLVGLLLHETPVVYISAHLPRMEELRKAPTRPPDVWEDAGLVSLRGGQDMFVRETAQGLRMLGAIRSVKQCLDCHGGEAGTLLGAFLVHLAAGETLTIHRKTLSKDLPMLKCMRPAFPITAAVLLTLSLAALAESPKPKSPGSSSPGISSPVDRHGDPLPPGAWARLGTVRLRQPGVWRVAFSPDGKVLASGGSDRKILFWDPANGKVVRALVGHNDAIRALAFSRDGKVLASGCQDSEICLWEVATGKEVRRIKGQRGALTSVAFSPDGTLLASAGQGNSVHVWDVTTGKERQCFAGPHGHYIHVVAFSPDGKMLAAARTNDTVDLWEVPTWKPIGGLHGHQERVTALAFAPDGRTLFTGAFDTTVRIWDVNTRTERRCLGEVRTKVSARDPLIQCLAVAPDGTRLAAGRQDGSISIWDPATGKELRRWDADGPVALRSMAFSADGKALASASREGIRLWDPETGKRLDPFTEPNGRPDQLSFSADGKFLAAAYDRQLVRIFDAGSRKERAAVPVSPWCLGTITFAPDRPLLAFIERLEFGGKPDCRIRFLDAASGREQGVVVSESKGLWGIAFSPRGDTLAGLGLREFILWDPATGKERKRFRGPEWSGFGLRYSPDGRVLAISGEWDVRAIRDQEEAVSLWDPANEKKVRSFGRGQLWGILAFSPDGKTIASSGQPPRRSRGGQLKHEVILWETVTGQERCRLQGHEQDIYAVAFSPDGRLIASSDREGVVRLWNATTGKEVSRLAGHRGWVECLAFSPDSTTLVSGSIDSTILFWDPWRMIPAQKPPEGKLGSARLTGLWGDLASPDAATAFRAMGALQQYPAEAVAFLRQSLPKAVRADSEGIARLIADLDSDQFATRERASAELARLGRVLKPALLRALGNQPSAEVRRRVQSLLARLEAKDSDPERLCAVRAVEVLERLASAEARKLLQDLLTVGEGPYADEARASLERLARRRETTP